RALPSFPTRRSSDLAVDGEVALAVVDDEQVSEAAQPVGEHHPPGRDRAHFLPRRRAYEKAFPGRTAIGALGTEAVREFTLDRQAQAFFQPGEGCVPARLGDLVVPQAGGRRREQLAQLFDQARQARLVALEVFYLAALLAQLVGDLREHLAVLGLLADDRGALLAARRLDRGDLRVPAPRALLELLQAREVRVQLGDQVGLRAGHVAVVMELAGDASGLVAGKQQLHSALLSVDVALREQPAQRFLARRDLCV